MPPYKMSVTNNHTIYTIGHSTHSLEEFCSLLASCDVQVLSDIRRFPGSRKFPQFNRDHLKIELPQAGIRYIHLETLGGRRKVRKNSRNDQWQNPSFQGYADYMETEAFEAGIDQLESLGRKHVTAYMCSEAVWWRCHRALVSDVLKAKGWTVLHIMPGGKLQEHPYTSVATVIGDRVHYEREKNG